MFLCNKLLLVKNKVLEKKSSLNALKMLKSPTVFCSLTNETLFFSRVVKNLIEKCNKNKILKFESNIYHISQSSKESEKDEEVSLKKVEVRFGAKLLESFKEFNILCKNL